MTVKTHQIKPTKKRFAGSSEASEVGLRWRVRSVGGSWRGAVASSCVSTVSGNLWRRFYCFGSVVDGFWIEVDSKSPETAPKKWALSDTSTGLP